MTTRPTPETDALFYRHCAEVADADTECLREVAFRQATQLLAHTREFERQRDEAVELVRQSLQSLDARPDDTCLDVIRQKVRAFIARLAKARKA